MGGPTSGLEGSVISTIHGPDNKLFLRSSPGPTKTFDDVRGA